jgi:hypothetical protein
VTSVWRTVDHTLQRNLLDGVLLLPPNATDPVHLNPSAAEIWALVDPPATAAEVSRVLADRHDVALADVTPVVDDALRDLAAVGAVVPADVPADVLSTDPETAR